MLLAEGRRLIRGIRVRHWVGAPEHFTAGKDAEPARAPGAGFHDQITPERLHMAITKREVAALPMPTSKTSGEDAGLPQVDVPLGWIHFAFANADSRIQECCRHRRILDGGERDAAGRGNDRLY